MDIAKIYAAISGNAKNFGIQERTYISINLMFALFSGLMAWGAYDDQNIWEISLLLTCFVIFASLFRVARIGKRYYKTLFIITTQFFISLLFYITDGFRGDALFLFVISFISLISISEVRNTIYIVLITALNIAIFAWIDYKFPSFISTVDWSPTAIKWLLFGLILVPSGFIINSLKANYAGHFAMVEDQKNEIEKLFSNLNSSVHYASNIQKALLPSQELLDEILPTHFVFFRPKDIVSGDFYWAEKIYHKIIVAAADCTGHGVPGAFMSMLGISLLNEIVMNQKTDRPSEILNKLREKVKQNLPNTNDGMDLSIVVIDRKNMKMEYAGANAPIYLFRENQRIEIKADRQPVGKYLKEREFTNHEIDIQINDMVYLFSDGFKDQIGGVDNKKFMSKRFVEMLETVHTLGIDEQKMRIEGTLDEWINFSLKSRKVNMGDIENILYALDDSILQNREKLRELLSKLRHKNIKSAEDVIRIIKEIYSEEVAMIAEQQISERKAQVDDILVFGFRI